MHFSLVSCRIYRVIGGLCFETVQYETVLTVYEVRYRNRTMIFVPYEYC